MSAVPHRQMVADFRAARAEIATATGAEKAELVGFCRGIRQAAIIQGYSFDAQVASADLAEIEPKFRVSTHKPVTVDEATTIIGWCRKQAESIHSDALTLRELLANRYQAFVFKDDEGPGIIFTTGGLTSRVWRPEPTKVDS